MGHRGDYCGWTAPLLERAELIIWLDTPSLVCVWRIILRHAKKSLAGDNNFPGLRLLARFAWGVLRDSSKPAATVEQLQVNMNYNSRATTAAHLAPWRAKVLRCRTRRDRARVLASLSGTTSCTLDQSGTEPGTAAADQVQAMTTDPVDMATLRRLSALDEAT